MKKIETPHLKWIVLAVIISSMFIGQISNLSPNPLAELHIIENLGNDLPSISGNHTPINIDGNADFATQSTENGWPGDGTTGNPYTIQNLVISTDVDGQSAIYIMNTDVFFIIKNCTLSATGGYDYSDQHSPSGIYLDSVSNGKMENNTAQYNSFNGFNLIKSNENTLTDNIVLNNGNSGFNLEESTDNTLTNNSVQDNGYSGFLLFYSDDNILTNNLVENHLEAAFHLMYSGYTTLTDNIMINNGIRMIGDNYDNILQKSVINNLVNGKPLVYMQGQSHKTVSLDAGQVILVDCSYMTVINQVISFANMGLQLHFSHHNILSNNTANYNSYGFVLRDSTNNTLIYNLAANNTQFGFYLMDSDYCIMSNSTAQYNKGYGLYLGSSSNEIKFNNFISNKGDLGLAYCGDSTNIFDYNYWSNHTSPDTNEDGIVDIPFTLEGEVCVDHHPVTKMNVVVGGEDSNGIPVYLLGAIVFGILSLSVFIVRKIPLKMKKK